VSALSHDPVRITFKFNRRRGITKRKDHKQKDDRQNMRTTTGAAARTAPQADHLTASTANSVKSSATILAEVLSCLDESKAEAIVTIDLAGKSSIGDYMVIASGRSDRHVGAIADQLHRKLKETGTGRVRLEGMDACDWVLIDTGDIIVHVFRPEVREFYKLEKMWMGDRPDDEIAH
jgi:ribosome-associated protein